MRQLLGAVILVCAFGPAAFAQPLRELAPRPEPAARPRNPLERRDLPILLLPFASINDVHGGWIGEAIQQNLLAELGRTPGVAAITGKSDHAVADVAAARKIAAEAGVPIVLFGSHHQSDGVLRVTGQVLDVRSGKLLGSIKATGPLRDLFGLEDALAAQLRTIVNDLLAPPAAAVKADPVERFARKMEGPAPKVEANGPVQQRAGQGEVFPWDRDAAVDRWNDRRGGPVVPTDAVDAAIWRYNNGVVHPYPAVYGGPYFYPWTLQTPYLRSVTPRRHFHPGGGVRGR